MQYFHQMKMWMIKMNSEIKTITVRMDSDLHKKLKIKAAAVDISINEYIISLIADSVSNVDLSGIVGE